MPAGRIPVCFEDQHWRLRANAPAFRAAPLTVEALAATLGIAVDRVADRGAQLVDVGVEQLIVQLVDAEAVRSCRPDVALMLQHLGSVALSPQVYVWANTGPSAVESRFFGASGTALEEDPATGSACCNLGGWLVGEGARGIRLEVSQGAAVGRPSRLVLSVDDDGGIHVAGRVVEVGAGTVHVR
ncbi:MAG: PhzF family phenazine biosynthesis protein, partial [Terracoccus sp.]